MEQYLFKSKRLGFRVWDEEDKPKMGRINGDPTVMEYFPSMLTQEETNEFVDRMKTLFSKSGFCYFAVDRLDTSEFIGFIGIAEQNFESDFTPCVDIGWRLAQLEWGKGFATEGAKECIQFAFNEIGLMNVLAICPERNVRSKKVMEKIGMKKIKRFDHPLLSGFKELEKCLLYKIENNV